MQMYKDKYWTKLGLFVSKLNVEIMLIPAIDYRRDEQDQIMFMQSI